MSFLFGFETFSGFYSFRHVSWYISRVWLDEMSEGVVGMRELSAWIQTWKINVLNKLFLQQRAIYMAGEGEREREKERDNPVTVIRWYAKTTETWKNVREKDRRARQKNV